MLSANSRLQVLIKQKEINIKDKLKVLHYNEAKMLEETQAQAEEDFKEAHGQQTG